MLKENVQTLSEKWSELSYLLTEAAADLDDTEAVDIVDNLSFNPFHVSLLDSPMFLEDWRIIILCCKDWVLEFGEAVNL